MILYDTENFTTFGIASAEQVYLLCRVMTKVVKNLEDFLQWRVWSWLRMNASYRLNTCKSRGSTEEACFFGWRPAHGWVTRIRPTHNTGTAARKSDWFPICHISRLYDERFIGYGWGCVRLGSRRGNGPPSRRSLGVLRGRSPTLVLRHGPDSYGRQQWGILVNGRKPEPAK